MKTIYKSFFGKYYDSEEECIKAEEKRRKQTFFVKICSKPDLTETGRMQHLDLYRVYSDVLEKEMCVFQIIKEMNYKIVGVSVQGYGIQEHCFFRFIDENEFDTPTPIAWGGRPLEYDRYDVTIGLKTEIKKL